MEPHDHPFTYDESQWNKASPATFQKEGKDTPAQEVYRTSKVLAEEKAWNMLEEYKVRQQPPVTRYQNEDIPLTA